MKITIFGGAFDPPHLGHIEVVKNFLQEGLSDQVIFLPVYSHAFDKKMKSSADRLAMLHIVKDEFFKNDPVGISSMEIDMAGMSITYQTLEELSKNNPENEYSFLIGSDNLVNFNKWHHYQAMLDRYQFFVYPRSGYSFDLLRKGMTPLRNMPEMKVSSTRVKEKLVSKQDVDQYLSPKVIHYIKENKLY